MKLHLSHAAGVNLFTAYGEGYVEINRQRFERTLVVMPESIIQDWPATTFEALAEADFDFLAGLAPEIVLLGTGKQLRFPHPGLSRALAVAQIGMEVMDTQAACRTYNILTAEGRKVAAALLL